MCKVCGVHSVHGTSTPGIAGMHRASVHGTVRLVHSAQCAAWLVVPCVIFKVHMFNIV